MSSLLTLRRVLSVEVIKGLVSADKIGLNVVPLIICFFYSCISCKRERRRHGERHTSVTSDNAYMKNTIHGCFTHLRIVHHTDGPAWMNHLMNCPLYCLSTRTDRPPLFEWFNHRITPIFSLNKRWSNS